jgi:hypothetical protein
MKSSLRPGPVLIPTTAPHSSLREPFRHHPTVRRLLRLAKLVWSHLAKVAQDRDEVSNHHSQDCEDDELDQFLGVGHVEAVDRFVKKERSGKRAEQDDEKTLGEADRCIARTTGMRYSAIK